MANRSQKKWSRKRKNLDNPVGPERDGRRKPLQIESLEERILLSSTWADVDMADADVDVDGGQQDADIDFGDANAGADLFADDADGAGPVEIELATQAGEAVTTPSVDDMFGTTSEPEVIFTSSFEGEISQNSWSVLQDADGWQTGDGSGIEVQNDVAGDASDGTSHVEMDSHGNSAMFRDVDTSEGGTFKLTFDYSPRPGVAEASNEIEVFWNGEKIDTISASGEGLGNTDWQRFEYELDADGADTSRIEFRAAGTSDSYGGYLDNITMTKEAPAVEVTELTAPEHGMVELNDDDTFTYTPFDGYSGEDSFTITISEDGELRETTINIEVEGEPGTLYASGFDSGSMNGIDVVSGDWNIDDDGALRVSGLDSRGDVGIVTMDTGDDLAPSFQVDVEMTSEAVSGQWQNGFVVLDYNGPDDFTYAGARVGANHWAIGHYDGSFNDVAQLPETIDPGTSYQMSVRVDGGNVSLSVDGTEKVSYDFGASLNDGEVGLVVDHAQTAFDNVSITNTEGSADTPANDRDFEVADTPDLSVADAAGAEDSAIPLNVSAALTDTDGSETLEITVSGVPDGATLSAGTDNGDGTWTLRSVDLDGLSFTPPENFSGEVELEVTATATEHAAQSGVSFHDSLDGLETHSGDWAADGAGLHVEGLDHRGDVGVLTMADDIDLPEAFSVDVDLVADGSGNWENGFVVLDYNGPDDFTYAGARVGADYWTIGHFDGEFNDLATMPEQIDHGHEYRMSVSVEGSTVSLSADGVEKATYDFGRPMNEGSVGLAAENAKTTFRDFSVTSGQASDTAVASGTIHVQVDAAADAPDLKLADASGNAGEPIPLEIDASVIDTDGSESLSVRIDGVPEGATLSAGENLGGGAWMLDPADLDGLAITTDPNADYTFDLRVTAVSSEADGPAPQPVTFASDDIDSYGGNNQDRDVDVAVHDSGATLEMTGNGWKSIDFPYSVTENTVLEVEFRTDAPGEIHGIGFDTDSGISENTTFHLAGSQNWGIEVQPAGPPDADGWQRFTIPVGEHFQGDFDKLVFVNDHDVSNPDAQSMFRNVTVSEGQATAKTLGSMSVEVHAGADDPTLSASDASGFEDSPVPLNIVADLTDTDGSETLEVTIAGVPEGATLSAGSLNDDGTWTLSPDQLDGLELIPGEDFAEDFDLVVTATSTEHATGQAPPPAVNFDQIEIDSYGGNSQDRDVALAIEDDGATLHMTGNGWKSIDFPYTVTENTVLEFEFRTDSVGEIHGIGFDSDSSIDPNQTFKLTGSQNWGRAGVADYDADAGGWQTIRIPVGEHYQGDFDKLFFVNDHDTGNPDAESMFRNLRVYEGDQVRTGPTEPDQASVQTTIHVNMTGVADKAALSAPNEIDGAHDQPIPLNVAAETSEGETLHLEITRLPEGAELSSGTMNPDGSWRVEAPDIPSLSITIPESAGEDHQIHVTAVTEQDGSVELIGRNIVINTPAVQAEPGDAYAPPAPVEGAPAQPSEPTEPITPQPVDDAPPQDTGEPASDGLADSEEFAQLRAHYTEPPQTFLGLEDQDGRTVAKDLAGEAGGTFEHDEARALDPGDGGIDVFSEIIESPRYEPLDLALDFDFEETPKREVVYSEVGAQLSDLDAEQRDTEPQEREPSVRSASDPMPDSQSIRGEEETRADSARAEGRLATLWGLIRGLARSKPIVEPDPENRRD